MMRSIRNAAALGLILVAAKALAQQNADYVNATSDLGVEFYAQGGVVVDGIAYFTSDDGELFNLPYFNGHFYAETTGGDYGTSKLLRLRASDGALVETLDYGRSISSCAPCIIAHGKVLSGDLGEDRIVVTEIAENSTLDWPGPFGNPQTNTFALVEEPSARPVAMREIRPNGKDEPPYPPSDFITSTLFSQERSRRPGVPPAHRDVKYGPYARNVMDVWLAESDKPTPVLVSIHGGGFRGGNKSVSGDILKQCLESGISVVAITYRLSNEAIAPAQFLDLGRF